MQPHIAKKNDICYDNCKKMGGAITVKSKWGKGTIVRFVVPQKVIDEKPIVSLRDRGGIHAATYIDMEQFEVEQIRDEYSNMIFNITEKLRIQSLGLGIANGSLYCIVLAVKGFSH